MFNNKRNASHGNGGGIKKISDDNRGQPIISQAVVHGNVAYFAGITPNPIVGDIKTQTAQVLRRVDELLNLVGTDNHSY